jgi:hypothetical protein
MQRQGKFHLFALSFAAALTVAMSSSVRAAENASSFFLLGLHGPLAGMTPPPGVYVENDLYINDGSVEISKKIPNADQVVLGMKADVDLDLPTVFWATPYKLLNGQLGLALTQPVAHEDVSGYVANRDGAYSTSGSVGSVGDPSFAASIGWSAGRLHWSATGSLNIPAGPYDPSALSNLALHRWAGDVSGAVTWLDEQTGHEASLDTGVTFNGTNPATDYTTGTEWHLEGDVSQYLSRQLSLGVTGYYYLQVTPDGGAGAIVGSFEGRAAAIGPTLGFDFLWGSETVSSRLRVLREFAVENRLTGTIGIFSLSFSL